MRSNGLHDEKKVKQWSRSDMKVQSQDETEISTKGEGGGQRNGNTSDMRECKHHRENSCDTRGSFHVTPQTPPHDT